MDEGSTISDTGGNMDEPLGLPRGSVRSLLSLGVALGAFAIAGFLLVQDASSDLTKVVGSGRPRGNEHGSGAAEANRPVRVSDAQRLAGPQWDAVACPGRSADPDVSSRDRCAAPVCIPGAPNGHQCGLLEATRIPQVCGS